MGDVDGGARLHIIVTDSRGTLLQDQINKVDSPYTSFIKVVPKSGATLEDIAQIAIGQAKAHLDSIVYLLGGTNNITHRVYNDPLRKFAYTERSSEELITYFDQLLDDTNEKLHKECPNTHFVMCPITGLDISLNIKDFNPMHQEAINDLVIEHKHKVVKINTMNNVPTPWTSSYVHHCRRNRYIHCYDRLSHDRLHPTLGLLKDWAKIFVNFASKLYL